MYDALNSVFYYVQHNEEGNHETDAEESEKRHNVDVDVEE